MTPSAAYCAPVNRAAASTIRSSTPSRESSELIAMPVSTSARTRSVSRAVAILFNADTTAGRSRSAENPQTGSGRIPPARRLVADGGTPSSRLTAVQIPEPPQGLEEEMSTLTADNRVATALRGKSDLLRKFFEWGGFAA